MGVYSNPILEGCHPDPSICRVGDEYLMVTSTFEYLPGLPVHRSRNLVDWELIGHVITDQLDFTGVDASRGLFAPTIRHDDGVFYVVCTHLPGTAQPPAHSGHFLVTATDPAGPWSEPVWLDGLPGIDPSLTFDGDRVWLTGTAPAAEPEWDGQCDVWIVELDRDSFAPVGERHAIWHGALRGAAWAEGPHVIAHPEGGWMLVAAEGGTDRDHAVCVAYADEITGPYRSDPGNPRLTHRHLGEGVDIQNVGHADLVQDERGSWWSVMLATCTSGGRNSLRGRQTHLLPVSFESGRPVFAPGSGRVQRTISAAGVPDQQPRPAVRTLDLACLAPDWTAVRWLPQLFVRPSVRTGWARVTATRIEPTEVGLTAFAGVRVPDDRCRFAVSLAFVAGSGGLRAGLLLRTTETAIIEVSVDRSGHGRVARTDAAGTTVLAQGPVAHDAAGVVCEIAIHDGTLSASIGAVAVDGIDTRFLETGPVGWFLGSWVGPFAVGDGEVDFAPARITTGEHTERVR